MAEEELPAWARGENAEELPAWAKPPEPPPTWGQVAREAVSNIPSSGLETAKAIAQPFLHPIETAENIGGLGIGALQKAGIAPGSSYEPYADAIANFYKDRYGSVENLKKTIAHDPVGTLADLSMVFSGGETALARMPGVLGKAGEVAGTVGRAVNPINIATVGVPAAARATKLIGDTADANAELAQAGVLRTPGQRLGGAFKTAEDAVSSIPILGEFMKGGKRTSIESFNQAVANQALEPIGMNTAAKAGHALVQDVEDKLGAAYDSVLPNLTFRIDGDLTRDLANTRRFMLNNTTQDYSGLFDRIVQSRFPAAARGATFTGEEFKSIESELKAIANKYRSSLDGQQRTLAEGLDRVGDAMKAGLQRNNPQFADQLAKINYGWAMYSRMRSAASRRATGEGIFLPSDLLASIKAADKSVGKGTFAKGDALMQKFAEAGQQVLPSQLPTSGTTERAMHAGALLGMHMLEPHTAIAGAAAAVPYTKAGMLATDYASRLPKGTIAKAALPIGRIEEISGGTYPYAKGGAVKTSKAEANYHGGTKAAHCSICTMFRPPSSCTAVRGQISPHGWCKFFEHVPGRADGGKITTKYDVVSGAVEDTKTGEVEEDRHIPEGDRKHIAAHERAEAKAMARGVPYKRAHEKYGIPAERRSVERAGKDWKEYSERIAGVLSHVEHEHVCRAPRHPHVDPQKAVDA